VQPLPLHRVLQQVRKVAGHRCGGRVEVQSRLSMALRLLLQPWPVQPSVLLGVEVLTAGAVSITNLYLLKNQGCWVMW
jgi:hypothetical protein